MRIFVSAMLILLATGCTTGNGDPGYPVNGRAEDALNKKSIAVQPMWRVECWSGTQKAVSEKLVIPKSAIFEIPSYEAYYDKDRDVTVLAISGNVKSRGNYGQNYRQSFYVTWEWRGNASKASPDADNWELADVSLYDQPL